jgi:medium-chain acyl-[acyl-carrier-protein] hydrolase
MIRDPWFYSPRRRFNSACRLFCFPFAGGGSGTFSDWHAYLPESVEIVCVQLPGRGSRFRETPFKNIGPLLAELSVHVPNPMEVPCAFFGHSIGALLAYELAGSLLKRVKPIPSVLFVSGMSAPQLGQKGIATMRMPDREFIEYVKRMNGIPEEVLGNEDLLEVLLPSMRADFELTESYEYSGTQLECPLVVFSGSDDLEAPPGTVERWAEITTGEFHRHTMPGDHFFLNSAKESLLALVAKYLTMHSQTSG